MNCFKLHCESRTCLLFLHSTEHSLSAIWEVESLETHPYGPCLLWWISLSDKVMFVSALTLWVLALLVEMPKGVVETV